MSSVRLTGDWAKAQHTLRRASRNLPAMTKRAIIKEAHWLRAKMLGSEGIQNPGLAPNSPWTRARKKSSKPLIHSGTLRASIGVIETSSGAFVGVRRKAKGRGKMSPVNLAKLHEKGATFTVTVTTKMRRFLMAMTLQRFGEVRAPAVGASLLIKIPARPFISPVLKKYGKESVIIPRVAKNLAKELRAPWRVVR